jgi:probable F420-dependent oxidoreductase
MVRLTAEIADGLLVMPFNTERHFRQRTLPAVDEGLRRGGRDRSELTVTAEVIVGCGRDEVELAAAMTGARSLLAFYASTPAYRPVLEVEGWEDLQPELNAMSKTGRWAEMPALLDDGMVSTLAVVGSPADVADEIRRRFGDQVERIGFYTPYAIEPETVGQLVDALRHGGEVTPPR